MRLGTRTAQLALVATGLAGILALGWQIGRPSSGNLYLPLGASEAKAAAAFGAVPSVPAQSATPAGITVAGEGTVKAAPDVAHVTAGVQTQAATAQEAQQENARIMSAVVAKLESMGYSKQDLSTSGLSVHPVFRGPGATPTAYQATNQMVVTVGDVSMAGTVFDAAVAAGANVAGSIRFGIKDDAPLRLQALREAVKAARQKGDAVADGLGVKISGVDAVIEQSAGGGPVPMFERAALAAPADASVPTPVAPGELTITAQVRVTFRY